MCWKTGLDRRVQNRISNTALNHDFRLIPLPHAQLACFAFYKQPQTFFQCRNRESPFDMHSLIKVFRVPQPSRVQTPYLQGLSPTSRWHHTYPTAISPSANSILE